MEENTQDYTAQYEAEMEPRDFEVAPGRIFVVRGINRYDWGRVYGVVPTLPGPKPEPGTEEADRRAREHGLQIQKAIYEDDEIVLGIRNPETGEICRKPAFNKVRFSVVAKIAEFASGADDAPSPKAAQIARSL